MKTYILLGVIAVLVVVVLVLLGIGDVIDDRLRTAFLRI
jgi:hypothetical protein